MMADMLRFQPPPTDDAVLLHIKSRPDIIPGLGDLYHRSRGYGFLTLTEHHRHLSIFKMLAVEDTIDPTFNPEWAFICYNWYFILSLESRRPVVFHVNIRSRRHHLPSGALKKGPQVHNRELRNLMIATWKSVVSE